MATLKEPQFADDLVLEAVPSRRHVTQPKDKTRRLRPADDTPFLHTGDFLRVRNDDSKMIIFAWDGNQWAIAPNEEAIVPFEALVNALGDPRSMYGEMVRFTDAKGNKGFIAERHTDFRRLFALYGVANENLDDESEAAHVLAKTPITEDCSLVSRAPKVTVTTQKGTKVIFPTQIPDMIPYPVESGKDRAGIVDQRRAVDKLQAENAALLDRMEAMEKMLNERLGGATVDPGPRKPE